MAKALKGTQQRLNVMQCSFPPRMGANEIDGESQTGNGLFGGSKTEPAKKPIDLITAVVDV
jgi:hypothetical protein